MKPRDGIFEDSPAAVKRLRSRIEHWRKTRKKRCRMPEPLWASAVRLAKKHGIYPISRALRVNYMQLKRRVEGEAKRMPRSKSSSPPVFVELDAGPLAREAGCIIELEDRGGRKMTIRLQGPSDVDVVGLTAAFWRRKR